jgi:hypothetical protein
MLPSLSSRLLRGVLRGDDTKKSEAGKRRPREYDSPKTLLVKGYFFLDDFFAVDFFAVDFLEALFFAAISAHHLSCRTGPPGRASWHISPDLAGKLIDVWESSDTGRRDGRR